MSKLTIDKREIEVPSGTTVLEAARRLGVEIPTLCHLEGCEASTSCLVCVVKIDGNPRLAPACATAVTDGMKVESETEEVRNARRTALELLLSDHLGDCLAPCFFACPAEMDIPTMLRQIASGDLRGAIATVKRDIALPAVLGRICPAPCEKACRRRELDGSISICLLKRYVADVDLARGEPFLPPCKPASGKTAAILGCGPTGLAAAYYLTQAGHACTIIDENDELGGRLLKETTPDELPRNVLQAEISQITRLGMVVRTKERIDSAAAMDDLVKHFDAVLIACGISAREQAKNLGATESPKGIHVEHGIFRTDRPGVFAAGTAVRGKSMVVRSAADGKEAATAIDQFLRGRPIVGQIRPFSTKIGHIAGEELLRFAHGAFDEMRKKPAAGIAAGYSAEEAARQAKRCLRCDCRGLHSCKLRKYAVEYAADVKRFKTGRRVYDQDSRHADVLFEPGKCIDCGLCIKIAASAGELGLTFIGRGFDVRVAVPFDRSLDEALQKAAAECIAACPTAALAWKKEASE
jgi:NADPH-dependent glutamate synthase beta subunit-like oxidoreductase/ferredoxin